VQAAASIVVLASLYVLLAAGYVLVYRASRVLNLAQGDLMMPKKRKPARGAPG